MTTQTYQDAARHLLQQAETELAAGDTRQASEKGWGAAAQAVKAVCESRGWRHRSHASLFRAIETVATETSDPEFHDLFDTANTLHINFYEDWMSANVVKQRLPRIRRLIDKLEELQ